MDMKRRGFLALLGFGSLIPFIKFPEKPLTEAQRNWAAFRPEDEYGRSISMGSPWRECDQIFIKNMLCKDARLFLPPGTVFEIRRTTDCGFICDYPRTTVAWYYGPYLDKTVPALKQSARSIAYNGSIRVGRYVA